MFIQLDKAGQLEIAINEMLRYTNMTHGYIVAQDYKTAKIGLDKSFCVLNDLKLMSPLYYKHFSAFVYDVKAEYFKRVNRC